MVAGEHAKVLAELGGCGLEPAPARVRQRRIDEHDSRDSVRCGGDDGRHQRAGSLWATSVNGCPRPSMAWSTDRAMAGMCGPRPVTASTRFGTTARSPRAVSSSRAGYQLPARAAGCAAAGTRNRTSAASVPADAIDERRASSLSTDDSAGGSVVTGTQGQDGSTYAAAMRRAVELADRGSGEVLPNPLVGCVIVAPSGEIVGEGWHERPGGPHAEVNALTAAGQRARGATAVVTLEPCNHTGRTGPCSAALIAAGVARVVIAVADPWPPAAGGAAAVRAAGSMWSKAC